MTLEMIGELRLRVAAAVVDELFVTGTFGALAALTAGFGRSLALMIGR